MKHIPSLETLRCFEAAGRHHNFTKAAAELNITHGAVSQRMRALEGEVGAKLFERNGNSMLLTHTGRLLLSSVSRILDDLGRAIEGVRNRNPKSSLRVSFPPGLAARWLLPRLFGFTEQNPDIEVDLVTGPTLANFKDDGIDLAVRFGSGNWAGLQSIKLLEEEFFPVCSPGFLEQHAPATPADLLGLPLLKDDFVPWDFWFRAAAVPAGKAIKGTSFSDASLLLQAASEGHGIALGRSSLLADDLASGRLVRLFDQSVRGANCYFIVYPPLSHELQKIRLFRLWLIEQARHHSTNARSQESAAQPFTAD